MILYRMEEESLSLLSYANFKHIFRIVAGIRLVPFLFLTHTLTHTQKNCVGTVGGIGRETARMCAKNG